MVGGLGDEGGGGEVTSGDLPVNVEAFTRDEESTLSFFI